MSGRKLEINAFRCPSRVTVGAMKAGEGKGHRNGRRTCGSRAKKKGEEKRQTKQKQRCRGQGELLRAEEKY